MSRGLLLWHRCRIQDVCVVPCLRRCRRRDSASGQVYLAMDQVGTGRSLLGNVDASTYSLPLTLLVRFRDEVPSVSNGRQAHMNPVNGNAVKRRSKYLSIHARGFAYTDSATLQQPGPGSSLRNISKKTSIASCCGRVAEVHTCAGLHGVKRWRAEPSHAGRSRI